MAHAVLTREANATHAYAEALRPLGLDVVGMPVTRTEPIDAGLDRTLREVRYDAIVCASARAAEALVEAATAPLPEVWAVGRATANVLEAAGLRVVVDDGVRDGASLARAMIAARPRRGQRILIPRARDGRTDAIRILVEAGAIVDAVDVYRTVPAPADDPAIAEGLAVLRAGAAVCAVFAPSQVEALDTLIGVRTIDTLFAAIGETTAQALREAGAGRLVVAAEPTPEGLANAIRAVYPATR